MTVSSITSSAAPATAAATAQNKALGQADFIRLMTTQMQMQDPLEPVDNKEMIAQMAQFSSLAGINDINTTLQAISTQLAGFNAVQTTAPDAETPTAETPATTTPA